MKISRTPLRVSLCGGGTDYFQWFSVNGGAILGGAINHYCWVVLHNGQITHFYDLPNKSGLGSSSAYTVGLLRACSESTNIEISRMATTLEVEKTNFQVGSQDQYLCAVGGFHHLRFFEHGIKDTPLEPATVVPLQDYLMLFDTHQYRRNGDVIPQQLKEMETHKETYSRMAEMADIGLGIIKEKDWVSFGKLLDEAWQLKKQMSNTISTPTIDGIYQTAIQAGAIGGKLLGGGGGGFIIFFVEPEKQQAVKNALPNLSYAPFQFEFEGTKVVYDVNR